MPMEKTFNAAEAEARISREWLDAKAFAAGANAKPGAEAFSIVIPPPNVTGSLHMGHAFNNTLQDILTRWHRMRGHDTLWQPGTDHAGIATQMVVERELAQEGNKGRRDMGREAFTARVWQQKQKSRGNIVGQLQRLGASCDWDREAFTMSGAPNCPPGEEGNFHDAVIKVFVDLYNKGLIYRGKRLVNWDPHFETAISDLEVEQIEVQGQMWHFKYPLAGGATYEYVEKDEDGNVTCRETRDYISIATTRPETMLGDGAVAVHPSDERYAPIVGLLCEIPVGPKEHRRLIPIITDEYPDPSFGSGAVKITGAHDFNDYAVAKRGNIPCYRLMDTRAQMRADGAPYAEAATIAMAVAKGEKTLSEAEVDAINLVPDDLRGLDRYEARKRVIDQITAEGLAVTVLEKSIDKETGAEHLERIPLVEQNKMMQPHGDRSKVVIEPMLTDQWFVDTAKIVEPALEAVRSGKVKILPASGEKTYYHWLENIEPWCISRQLWWGHQVPVWYGPPQDADTAPEAHTKGGLARAFCGASFEDVRSQAALVYE
ncbi:MAG: class I tRNA ligase family protein, partial [Paracoccaceae bacterium]